MVTLKTYIYTGEPNRVNKTLEENNDYKGLLNDRFNVLSPVVRFRTKTPVSFNYAYLVETNRYYFVESVEMDGDLCTVRLKVDVLMSYKDKILASTGTLTTGEDTNKYISNRNNIFDVRPQVRKLDFPNKGLLDETGKIIMVTIKGNQ